MDARLILLDPPAARREVKLSLPATIGRSRDAKIKLIHGQVSRVHCEFYERDGVLRVRDLGSTNGTYVGEERVDESAVPPGETVTIGAVRFRAEYEPDADAVLPATVLAPTGTIRKATEATFRAGAVASAGAAANSPAQAKRGESGASGEPLDLEPLSPNEADDTQFLPSLEAMPTVLPLDHGGDEANPLPAAGTSPERETGFPRAVDWDALELAPVDEESPAADAQDSSLHIFPPSDDRDAASQPADDLKWRAPGSSSEAGTKPSNSPAGSQSESASGDDLDFERFLQSLDDDKGA